MSRPGYNFCIIECYRKWVFIVWFFRKIYLLCLFVGIWFKLHFPLKGRVTYNFKVIIQFFLWFVFIKTCEKRDVLSAKILQVDWMLSGKLLMYIRNKRGPRTEPCGTPDFINSQEEIWPLRTTLWLRSWR